MCAVALRTKVYVEFTPVLVFFFFFKQKTAYEMRISDWSSDVCSSDLLGVVVPPTRSFNVRSHVTRAGEEWRLTRIDGRFGESDISGRLTVSTEDDERLKLDADLRTRRLDIIDAGPFIGYSPERLERQGRSGVNRGTEETRGGKE